MQRAVFLDRDGTLVRLVAYPSRPEQLELYTSAVPALRDVQEKGLLLIIVTNQSGIARGYFGEADLQRMHTHFTSQLKALEVQIHAIYHCPHHPDGVIPDFARRCDCRKPLPGMLLRAAAAFDIDLQRSWCIGDTLYDVEAGNRAGCRSILIDLGTEPAPTTALRCPTFIARSLDRALHIVSTVSALPPELDLLYRPPLWHIPVDVVSSILEKEVVDENKQ